MLAWWVGLGGHPHSPQMSPQPQPSAGRRGRHTATFWFIHANAEFYSRKPWPAETGHKPFNLCAHRVSVNASDLSTHGKTPSLQKSLQPARFPGVLEDVDGIVAAQSQQS